MSKYDPLRRYLSRQKETSVILTFGEMESLIGRLLPKAATRANWWSDPDEGVSPPLQAAAWRDAGFSAVLIAGQDRARFDRKTPG
ncbi:hypothetical protein BH10PSE1_BH10PSE1_18120 [soil metagenome]